MSHLLQIHEPGETPLPHADLNAIGIDLGTTHSVVAISDHQQPEILHDEEGNALIPSIVAYGKESIEVGRNAQARRGQKGWEVISSIKRLMGRSAVDARKEGWQHIASGPGALRLELGEKKVTPVEISAEILKYARAQAEQDLGRPVSKAVITVPAYFDDAARTATRDAARLAGLEVLRLINEPTAAALAYGLDKGAEGIYAIYDLGGGTFDISILRLEAGVFQVLSTAGDTQLGGGDFDRLLAEHLLSKAGQENTAESIHALLPTARATKEKLSTEPTQQLTLGKKQVSIAREEYDALIGPLVGQTFRICEQALADAELEKNQIKGVVMVGGSTRDPFIRAQVGRFFDKPPLCDINPDEVVALGAALQAEALTKGSNNLLLDVTPLSLGLETMGGIVEKLIYRNTPIPVSISQEFTTYQDGQQGMIIHVVQGEREKVTDCRSLARFELKDIPPLPAGIARIKVSFTLDADGLLTVSAREETTGAAQIVEVQPSYGLSAEEMEAMLLASMEHAKEDIIERLLIESRVEADHLIHDIERAMKDSAALLLEGEKAQIESQIARLREAMRQSDREKIEFETTQLGEISTPFAERRMDKAVRSALKGTRIEEHEGF